MKFTKFAIVLIFFLSLGACTVTAFLSTVRENEKEKRIALQTIRLDLEDRLKVLEEEKVNYQKQVDSLNNLLQNALGDAEKARADLDQIRAALEEKDKTLEKTNRDIEDLQRAIQVSQDRNRELEGELERYEQNLKAARESQDALGPEYGPVYPFASSPAPVAEAPSEDQPVRVEQKKSPSFEIVTQEKPREAETKDVVMPSESLQAGRVLLINRKFNFVVMNMGGKQGLKVGDSFLVHEGDEKIAKVEVEKLYDDFSAAKILEQYGDPSLLKEGNLVTRM